jgi:hypothetical protein
MFSRKRGAQKTGGGIKNHKFHTQKYGDKKGLEINLVGGHSRGRCVWCQKCQQQRQKFCKKVGVKSQSASCRGEKTRLARPSLAYHSRKAAREKTESINT